MNYLLIIVTMASDGATMFDVQKANLSLPECLALLTLPEQSCEPDTSLASIVIHQGTAIVLPRCEEGEAHDNCAADDQGYYLIDGRRFHLE